MKHTSIILMIAVISSCGLRHVRDTELQRTVSRPTLIYDVTQQFQQVTTHPNIDLMPAISNDGQWIAFASKRSGNMDIWVKPIKGGKAIQVTFHQSDDLFRAQSSEEGIHFWGTPNILALPEFADRNKIVALMGALERKEIIVRIMGKRREEKGLTITIGESVKRGARAVWKYLTTPLSWGKPGAKPKPAAKPKPKPKAPRKPAPRPPKAKLVEPPPKRKPPGRAPGDKRPHGAADGPPAKPRPRRPRKRRRPAPKPAPTKPRKRAPAPAAKPKPKPAAPAKPRRKRRHIAGLARQYAQAGPKIQTRSLRANWGVPGARLLD